MLRILFLYKKSTLFAFDIENLSGFLVDSIHSDQATVISLR